MRRKIRVLCFFLAAAPFVLSGTPVKIKKNDDDDHTFPGPFNK
jgi:hypothetical protein